MPDAPGAGGDGGAGPHGDNDGSDLDEDEAGLRELQADLEEVLLGHYDFADDGDGDGDVPPDDGIGDHPDVEELDDSGRPVSDCEPEPDRDSNDPGEPEPDPLREPDVAPADDDGPAFDLVRRAVAVAVSQNIR